MFLRGIRGISLDDNISAVVFGSKGRAAPIELTRQLLSYNTDDPDTLILTPAGELMLVTSKEQNLNIRSSFPNARFLCGLSKLSVCGVCMNSVGAKIHHTLFEHGVNVLGISMCDIAVSFIINAEDSERAVSAVRENFILEV